MPLFLLPLLSMLKNAKLYLIGAAVAAILAMLAIHEYNVHTMQTSMENTITKNVTLQVQNKSDKAIIKQVQHDVVLSNDINKSTNKTFRKTEDILEIQRNTFVNKVDSTHDTTLAEAVVNQEMNGLFQCFEDISNDKDCDNNEKPIN